MDSSDFGLWAMLAFWASAIGGVVLGVQWAKRKGQRSPAPRDVIIKSLKERLENGDITPEEYQSKLDNL